MVDNVPETDNMSIRIIFMLSNKKDSHPGRVRVRLNIESLTH